MTDVDADFDRLYRANYRGLVALGASMCGDVDLARSLAQDTMIRAYESREDVLSHPAPLAWLRRVMHNTTIDHLRRTGAEQRAVTRLASRPSERCDAVTDPTGSWFDLVHTLTPQQRAVATLFYAHDLSVTTIAETLALSEGTVKSTLSKARKRMRRALENGEPS